MEQWKLTNPAKLLLFCIAGYKKKNKNTIQSLLELNAVFRSKHCSRYTQATFTADRVDACATDSFDRYAKTVDAEGKIPSCKKNRPSFRQAMQYRS